MNRENAGELLLDCFINKSLNACRQVLAKNSAVNFNQTQCPSRQNDPLQPPARIKQIRETQNEHCLYKAIRRTAGGRDHRRRRRSLVRRGRWQAAWRRIQKRMPQASHVKFNLTTKSWHELLPKVVRIRQNACRCVSRTHRTPNIRGRAAYPAVVVLVIHCRRRRHLHLRRTHIFR